MIFSKTLPNGDILEVNIWQWLRYKLGAKELLPYSSQKYHFSAESISEYWREVARRESAVEQLRLKASSTSGGVKPLKLSLLEVVQILFVTKYGLNPGVVIFNIDDEYIARLAEYLPGVNAADLMEDFMLFPMPSRDAARKALGKIPSQFADAVAIDGGLVIQSNVETSLIPA